MSVCPLRAVCDPLAEPGQGRGLLAQRNTHLLEDSRLCDLGCGELVGARGLRGCSVEVCRQSWRWRGPAPERHISKYHSQTQGLRLAQGLLSKPETLERLLSDFTEEEAPRGACPWPARLMTEVRGPPVCSARPLFILLSCCNCEHRPFPSM